MVRKSFRTLTSLWNKVVKLYDHAETASAVAGVVFKGVNPGDHAPAIAKGLYGFFGHQDERDFIVLLRKLDNGGNGPNQAAILSYLAWQFPNKTKIQRRVSHYYGNHFRTFIVKMGEKEALKLLAEIAQDIINHGGKVAAFRKLRKKLRLKGVPLPPDNAEQEIKDLLEAGKQNFHTTPTQWLSDLADTVEQKNAQQQAQPRSRIDRFMDRIIK